MQGFGEISRRQARCQESSVRRQQRSGRGQLCGVGVVFIRSVHTTFYCDSHSVACAAINRWTQVITFVWYVSILMDCEKLELFGVSHNWLSTFTFVAPGGFSHLNIV